MNFFAAFQSEVFRPLVTLIIPGALGISSWLTALCWKYPKLGPLMVAQKAETYLVLFLAITAVGIIIEDCGAKIEIYWDTRANDKTPKDKFDKDWYAYLRTAFVADPIGRGYVRTLVLRLKFQLGILLSSVLAICGVVWLPFLGLHWFNAIVLILIGVSLAAWHYKAASDVHGTLATLRAELLKEIRIIGPEQKDPRKSSRGGYLEKAVEP
jgi:hypothetical protein